jgi:hypothetical protein
MGDLSPKGRVAVRQLVPVLSWQSVLPNGLKSDFHPKTGASRLSPTRPFGERSPTFEATFTKNAGIFTRDAGTFTRNAGTFTRNAGTFTRNAGTFTRNAGTFTRNAGIFPTIFTLKKENTVGQARIIYRVKTTLFWSGQAIL